MSEFQHDLFAQRPVFEKPAAARTIQEQFQAFHEANPWVLEALVRLARDYQRRGARRVGIGHLFEILRWQFSVATQGDEFKLNNNYRSRYARLIAAVHPQLADLFETRELKAA